MQRRRRRDVVRRANQDEPTRTLLKPNPSALALDIDGTITTASPAVVHELVRAARVLGSKVAVNTARPASYCRDPYLTKFLNIPLEDHYCYDGNVPWTFRNLDWWWSPAAKVRALESIRENAGVVDKRCVILVDDRGRKHRCCSRAGFGVLQVSDEGRVDGRRQVVSSAVAGVPAGLRRLDKGQRSSRRRKARTRGVRRHDASRLDAIDAGAAELGSTSKSTLIFLPCILTHAVPAASEPSPRPTLLEDAASPPKARLLGTPTGSNIDLRVVPR